MRIIKVEQGSPEWHAVRAGKVTASKVADMIARTKSGWGAGRKNYAAQLIVERLTGAVEDGFKSEAMLRGSELEAEAREVYEFVTGSKVEQVGFVLHPELDAAGASPDGLVDGGGCLEIKCPNSATHLETLMKEAVPSKYVLQMQFQMICCERKWCDYVSYDPRLPGDMAIFIKRIERDDELCATLNSETITFLDEVDETVAQLVEKYRTQEAAE